MPVNCGPLTYKVFRELNPPHAYDCIDPLLLFELTQELQDTSNQHLLQESSTCHEDLLSPLLKSLKELTDFLCSNYDEIYLTNFPSPILAVFIKFINTHYTSSKLHTIHIKNDGISYQIKPIYRERFTIIDEDEEDETPKVQENIFSFLEKTRLFILKELDAHPGLEIKFIDEPLSKANFYPLNEANLQNAENIIKYFMICITDIKKYYEDHLEVCASIRNASKHTNVLTASHCDDILIKTERDQTLNRIALANEKLSELNNYKNNFTFLWKSNYRNQNTFFSKPSPKNSLLETQDIISPRYRTIQKLQ